MPNWCSNYGSITHKDPKKIKELAKAIEDEKFCHYVIPLPKSKEVKGWYDWCIEHWSTKWDIYHAEVVIEDENTLRFWFETAWSPPENVFNELISQGYEVILAYYETGMDYCGVLTNENHEYTEDVLSHTKNKTLPKWVTDAFDFEEIYGEDFLNEQEAV
jgi:hypothetical protein|tara:strand:+ start:739 stop:1218 length:480 start_codon:yes stop_codon:yes gene_type:complete